MAKTQTVRIEIPAGTVLNGGGVKVARTFQVNATPSKWRGMTTAYTFILNGKTYSVDPRGSDVRRVEDGEQRA